VPAFQIVGHRGARNEAPENTIAGFLHARRLGLAAVELDVHLSSDGRLVVIHDGTVDRTTDGAGPVGDFTAAELAALDARAAFPDWPERVGVPTLDEVLDALGDMPSIQIEIKKDTDARMERLAEAVLRVIHERQLESRVVLSSFEVHAVEAIGQLAPSQARAYIGAYDTPAYLDTALRLGCTQVDIALKTSSRQTVAAAHREGLRVVGFQCNSPDALEQCLDWGVDAATSDEPTTMHELLARRRDR
jgi:glycerophosphoryl diester phosphodiesterase